VTLAPQARALIIIFFIFLSGIASDEGNPVFNIEEIKALSKKTLDTSKKDPLRNLILFCDPNAGGQNHMAMAALAFVEGKVVVKKLTVSDVWGGVVFVFLLFYYFFLVFQPSGGPVHGLKVPVDTHTEHVFWPEVVHHLLKGCVARPHVLDRAADLVLDVYH
jgi:hypothetical protein